MSSGVNKAIVVGFLGKDPELKYTSDGKPVVNFTIATNESWSDKQGAKQERTEWHRVVAWGKLAELCSQYISKGSQVYVEGKLQTTSWDDNDGVKRSKTEIVARDIQFLGSSGEKRQSKKADNLPDHEQQYPITMDYDNLPF